MSSHAIQTTDAAVGLFGPRVRVPLDAPERDALIPSACVPPLRRALGREPAAAEAQGGPAETAADAVGQLPLFASVPSHPAPPLRDSGPGGRNLEDRRYAGEREGGR